jgi:polyhydroxybutyrate depolymerase
MSSMSPLIVLALLSVAPLGPGDHGRSLKVDGRERSYLVHVPPQYDPKRPTPVVLALHGAAMNALMMRGFCDLDKKADQGGFVAVYPNGTGLAGLLLAWNAGGLPPSIAEKRPNDVAFMARLLDDLASVMNVDPKRVYATGMSNGGMMCYRLAAELSDRIAAIAPVGGTMAVDCYRPKRPVPVMHFHGRRDPYVPYDGLGNGAARFLAFKSVEDTIGTCAKANGCAEAPAVSDLPDKARDGTKVHEKTYRACTGGAEVVLVTIEGAGHTWPGEPAPEWLLGKATKNVSANDRIWEFFQKHPIP